MPAVSVITPVYKAAAFVQALVDSVAAQSFTDFEWICVDDASPDDSLELLEQAARGRVQLRTLRLPVNSGPAEARNAGVRAALGRFIAFIDADDMWLPDKLRAQVEFMTTYGHRFTFHDYRRVSADGRSVGGIIRGPDVVDWKTLHKRRGLGCLTVMLDRSVVPEVPFPEAAAFRRRLIHDDFAGWSRILATGVVAHRLPLDLARYRVSPSARTANMMHNLSSTWGIYRTVERIPFVPAAWYFANYVVSASLLRLRAKLTAERNP